MLRFACRHDLLRPGDRVGVAVSGGADSVALLRMLMELRRDLGLAISVVHFNHKIRGAESESDEDFVRALAAKHDLALICECGNAKAYAADNKLSLETGGRELRYRLFRNLLESNKLDTVATGHTLDDQAETFLLKLLRGAGTRGLAGIYPKIRLEQGGGLQPGKSIVRPLLSTRRSEIVAFLHEVGQNWREDSSNRDQLHTRNRIRHEILPGLKAHINPRAAEILSEAAELARAEEDFWKDELSRLVPQLWCRTENRGTLNSHKLKALPLAVRRRIVRAAAQSLGSSLEFQHVESILALHAPGRASLPHGWSASASKGLIHFQDSTAPASDYQYPLQVPGRVEVPEAGILIEASMASKELNTAGSEPECFLSAEQTAGGLVVRNWRAGDRFWPVRGKAPKKLKELLQKQRVTGRAKKLWPVIARGDEILWVLGLGVNRNSRPQPAGGVLIRDSPLK